MKVRIRFIKRGPIQYIGHLDLMRYFQKVFRRCGLDVAYSKGFNPHQLLSFASPLGVGLTSIGEYLDATLNSFNIINTANELSITEWISRINEYSNDMVIVTAIIVMPDDIKPSMSLLSAASYIISFSDETLPERITDYFNNTDRITFTKVSKKSTSEIDLKENIFIVTESRDIYDEKMSVIATYDPANEKNYMDYLEINHPLYVMCAAGSSINIKPEMLVEAYMKSTEVSDIEYDIIRLDMFTSGERSYISMAK